MDELNLYYTFQQQEPDLQLLQGFESRLLSQSGEVSFANLLLVQRTIVFLNFVFEFLCLDTYLCNFLRRSRE